MQEYPDLNDNRGKSTTNIAPFLLGAMVGAGIALLLAPAHGRDTRKRVGSTMKKLGDDARHVFNRTRDNMEELKDDAKSAIEKGRQEYVRTRTGQSPTT